MIIQMQGAVLDVDASPTGYTVPTGHAGDWQSTITYGDRYLFI